MGGLPQVAPLLLGLLRQVPAAAEGSGHSDIRTTMIYTHAVTPTTSQKTVAPRPLLS